MRGRHGGVCVDIRSMRNCTEARSDFGRLSWRQDKQMRNVTLPPPANNSPTYKRSDVLVTIKHALCLCLCLSSYQHGSALPSVCLFCVSHWLLLSASRCIRGNVCMIDSKQYDWPCGVYDRQIAKCAFNIIIIWNPTSRQRQGGRNRQTDSQPNI